MCQSIDKAGRMRQAPTLLKNYEIMRLSKETQNRDVVREGNLDVRACDTDTKHCRPPTSVRPRTAWTAKVTSCAKQQAFGRMTWAEKLKFCSSPPNPRIPRELPRQSFPFVSGVVFDWLVAPRVDNIHLNLGSGRVHAPIHHMTLHVYL